MASPVLIVTFAISRHVKLPSLRHSRQVIVSELPMTTRGVLADCADSASLRGQEKSRHDAAIPQSTALLAERILRRGSDGGHYRRAVAESASRDKRLKF